MSRRAVSPIRTQGRSDTDPRENIIRKLKEDLIVARGRQKQLAILQNYLVELIQKTKLLSAETAKADEEGRLKLQLTMKTINQLKKQVDMLRAQLRNTTNQLSEVEDQEAELKNLLNSKIIQIQKLKKQGHSLNGQNEKLLNQHYRLRSQQQEANHEIKKLNSTIRDYEGRLADINRKVLEVKSFINEMSEENTILRQKLKSYENQNTGMGNDLDQKQNKIDNLQRTFAQKHELIKNQVEQYIELEHKNQKNLKQTKHKLNLVKIQNQKFNELSSVIKKIQKAIVDKTKDLDQVTQESGQIRRINQDFVNQNARLKQDLAFCHQHLQNILKHNAYIQQQMENYVKQDEAIINVIRRKRVIPVVNNFNSLRTSRNEGKNTIRTYH